MNVFWEILQFVLANVWTTLPFFLLSIALSVLVHQLRLEGMIKRAFANRMGVAIVLATVVGAFSPFCACTIVPVVAGLLASGVPLAPIMAFWIASPTMDPEILTLSIGILGWPLAVTRLVATLLLSLGAGYVTWALSEAGVLPLKRLKSEQPQREEAMAPSGLSLPVVQPAMGLVLSAAGAGCGCGGCGDSCAVPVRAEAAGWVSDLRQQWQQLNWVAFGREFGRECWTWGKWLLLAFVLEALILRYVAQTAVAQTLGHNSWFAVPAAALVGIPLYLTELSALPIVAGLLAQGMAPGAAIAFLIAGPVTTLPAMTAVYGIVTRRIFFLYLGIGLIGAMIFGWLTNLLWFV